MKIPFKKLNEEAVIPEFKHPEDAGKDLFPVSVKYNKKYDRLEYGLGFATAIPEGYEVEIRPRSSQTKKDWYIPNAPGTIDAGYRGEWFVMFKHRVPFETLFPDGDYELNINELINELAPYKPGEAIAQALLHKREDWEFTEVNELDETERGADGGLNREGK
jgi:dUTP pyrophosphatase